MAYILILFPLVVAALILIVRNRAAIGAITIAAATVLILLSIWLIIPSFGKPFFVDMSHYEWVQQAMLVIEAALAAYIVFVGIKNKQWLVVALAAVQAPLMIWYELFSGAHIEVKNTLYIDNLSTIMILIIGVIGSLICIYAVAYMKDFSHHHHHDVADRRPTFFAILFIFLSAMFGLVMSNNITWLFFFWEITTFCSFLLIGYTKAGVAVTNSFRALKINLAGGLAFAFAIVIFALVYHLADVQSIVAHSGTSVLFSSAVMLVAFAGLTKSAQMPFSTWLLGAMVAPTPTSALLHSSTMVKAGVFIIIRMAPQLGDSVVGHVVTFVGAFTFLVTAMLAISQSDAKKVLAYSTVSNLGLIVTCAGIGTGEALWAAIMLIIFHAVAKSLLFLSVGSAEHHIGSRNVEDMDGLLNVSVTLTMFIIIGIAGMFLAPFGMLISKWAAMKAFLDSNNILVVIAVAFGSSLTLFFWTKWLGKLVANLSRPEVESREMSVVEKYPLIIQAGLTVAACVAFPFVSSSLVAPFLHIAPDAIISQSAAAIMVAIMSALFIVPFLFIPLYKNRNIREVSVYMAGENTGDNLSYHGSMGKTYKVELRNWYMAGIFGEDKLLVRSQQIGAAILIIGVIAVAIIRF